MSKKIDRRGIRALPKTIDSSAFGVLEKSGDEPEYSQYIGEISFNGFEGTSLVFRFDRTQASNYKDDLRLAEAAHGQLLESERQLLKKSASRILKKCRSFGIEWSKPAKEFVCEFKKAMVLIYDIPSNQIIVGYVGNEHMGGHDLVVFLDAQLKFNKCHLDG